MFLTMRSELAYTVLRKVF